MGASLDPAALAVFTPLIAAAKAARVKIAKEGKEAAKEYVGGYRDAPAHTKAGFDGIAKQGEDSAKRTTKAARDAAREQKRILGEIAAEKKRWAREEESMAIASMRKQHETQRNILGGAGRTFGGIVSKGIGLAGEVARGAGVDFSVASLVGRNKETQKTATDITASSYVEGAKGSVGIRQDPKTVIAAAKEAANAAAISEEVALAGLQKFVGKSTDLQTGLQILTKMAVQSKATGSNLEDVLDAAGDIAVKLDETPDKAKILAGIMATVAKQGQLGASELRSMAPYIGRIVSSSSQFASGPAKAAAELGAVFQITKKLQGQTPASAATSVSRFVQDLTSKSGLKALHGAGVKDTDIFADKGKTKLKDLSDIIPVLLGNTGGDLTKLAKMLPNVKSGSVLKAFSQVYNEGEKGGKGGGAKAVAGTFAEFGGAMSEKQISESLAQALKTTESKAQLFQNRLQDIADGSMPKVMDAMEKLAPVASSAAQSFANLVTWAAGNPMEAVVAAMAASVAKAAVGEALKVAIGSSLGTIGALSIVATTVGIMAIDAIISQSDKAKTNVANTDVSLLNDTSTLRGAVRNKTVTQEDLDAAQRDIDTQTERTRKATATRGIGDLATGYGSLGGLASGAANLVNPEWGTSFANQAQGAQDRVDQDKLVAAVNESRAAMQAVRDAITGGTLKVIVTNQPGAPMGGAAPGARTGPQPTR